MVDLIAKVSGQRKTDRVRPRYLSKSPNTANFLADLDLLAGDDGTASNPAAQASNDEESEHNGDLSLVDT